MFLLKRFFRWLLSPSRPASPALSLPSTSTSAASILALDPGPGPRGPAGPSYLAGSTGAAGANGPSGPSGPSSVPGFRGHMGHTGPTSFPQPFLGPVPRYFPDREKDQVASLVDIGSDRRIEFRTYCRLSFVNENPTFEGKINIYLVAPGPPPGISDSLLSSVNLFSPNSPASSIPWLASMIDLKLKVFGMRATMDMGLLEEASKKAYSIAFENIYLSMASIVVGKIEHTRAQDLWAESLARYVMES